MIKGKISSNIFHGIKAWAAGKHIRFNGESINAAGTWNYQACVTEQTDIPTFDSSDREWDSLHTEYLLFDTEECVLISCKSGYCIAQIEVYSGLISASKSIRPWFEKMGFFMDKGFYEKTKILRKEW